MTTRRDWVKDCISEVAAKGTQLSLPELKASFCDFCAQPECTRSLFGTSKFEQRVSTWKERLFTQVPRMQEGDPRFSAISSKGFILIPPEALLSKSSGSWLDPRDVKPVSVSVPESVKGEESSPAPAQEEPAPAQPAPAAPTPEPMSREVVLINTPVQRGIMLPGGTQTGPRPQRDQWDAPQPVRPGEKVVQRGATVRFGVDAGEQKKDDKGDSKS